MDLLHNMQTILAPVNVDLFYRPLQKRIGLDTIRRPNEDEAIDYLFKQKSFFGNLINRAMMEYLRYSIQQDLLVKINDILLVLNNEIETAQ